MKLVIERWKAQTFVYREDDEHHRVAEKQRIKEGSERVSPDVLDFECAVEKHAPPRYHWHVVFTVTP